MTDRIREELRAHQVATDCTDDRMVGILCDFIQKLDDDGQLEAPWEQWLFEFVVENLERGPGDIPPHPMPRYDPRFNAQDQQSMFEGALEEGSDLGRKDIAQLVMASWDMVSCIAACTVIDGEHSCEPLAEMLQRIDNKGDEEYITGEFLREHDDGDGYPALLDFAKRMGLIDEAEENITDLGREYMESLV